MTRAYIELFTIFTIVFMVLNSCSKQKNERIYQIRVLDLCGSRVELIEHKGSELSQVIWLNVHEDEKTSIEALWKMLDHHDITFAYLHQNGSRRLCFGDNEDSLSVDPNRIYTPLGITKTLSDTLAIRLPKQLEVGEFANQIKTFISSKKWVVTVHNNTEDNYSIMSYLPGQSESGCTRNVHVSHQKDPDDFVYTTSEELFELLKAKDVNTILQHEDCTDDGSLSVYCGVQNINYINIEAQHGHLDEQLRLLQLIYNFLDSEF